MSEKKKVAQALIEATLKEPPLAVEHESLASQLLVRTMAEQWIGDNQVGIEKVKSAFGEVLAVDARDENVNPKILEIKARFAFDLFQVYERYLAARVRNMSFRKPPAQVIDAEEDPLADLHDSDD